MLADFSERLGPLFAGLAVGGGIVFAVASANEGLVAREWWLVVYSVVMASLAWIVQRSAERAAVWTFTYLYDGLGLRAPPEDEVADRSEAEE